MAGVPFDALDGLATTQSAAVARKVIAHRAEQRRAKETIDSLYRRGDRPLSAEASQALRVAVRTNRAPMRVPGVQPAFFTSYASAASAVASAEDELDVTLAREIASARASLVDSSRIFLPRYLVFASRGVRDSLVQYVTNGLETNGEIASRNSASRKIEQRLLLYLQRVAAKNDTFAEFGPGGWGEVRDETIAVTISPQDGIARRSVFLERWTAHGLAALINGDCETFGELCPRLNPNGRISGLSFIETATGEKIELTREQIGVIQQCDGRTPVHALAASENLDELIRNNVLRSVLAVPALDPDAFSVLLDDVQKWRPGESREKWLSLLQTLADMRDRFAGLTTANERARALDQVTSLLDQAGAGHKSAQRFLYAATNPIGEECFRECNFQIARNLIDEVAIDAAPWIDLWRDSFAFIASRVSAGLRRVFERAAAGQEALPLPAFLRACSAAKLPLTGPGLVALAVMAFQEVKMAFRERLRPHLDEDEYELTAADCHIIRDQFDYPQFDEYTYPSADLQLSAESIEAVRQGHYQWVVSELHPPAALLHHGVYWKCPNKPELKKAFALTAGGRPNFHFGFFAADFTSHTTVRLFDAMPDLANFVAPERANPSWRTVRPADAEVFVDRQSGDVCLRNAHSGEYLGSFARAWIIPLGFHPFQFGGGSFTPRLRCGRVVVQRRTWTVQQTELAIGDFRGVSRDLAVAVEQLRAMKKWPRYIYIRPSEQALRRSGAEGRDKDTKPVFIDLESYLFQELFYRWLAKSGELEVTEMLPDPDHLLWRQGDRRHTFELRTLILPRK